TDGVEKMSKSYGNYIGISEPAKDIFGKTLSIPDNLIYTYYELATNIPNAELKELEKFLETPGNNPRDAKRRLAKTIVAMYHDEEAAESAEKEFDRIFVDKGLPDEIEEYKFDQGVNEIGILDLILTVKFAPSKQEARRLVLQGGVTVDGERVDDIAAVIVLDKEKILKVGKRKFIKITC
ncbi:MAG: tyrosine--tRNA ligase, partial [Bacteroidota bacterium]